MLQGSTLKIDPDFHIDDTEIAVFELTHEGAGVLMTVTLDFTSPMHKVSTALTHAGMGLTFLEQATVVKVAANMLDSWFDEENDPLPAQTFGQTIHGTLEDALHHALVYIDEQAGGVKSKLTLAMVHERAAAAGYDLEQIAAAAMP